MGCDVIDVNSVPDESAKESSYFHVHGSRLCRLLFPFSVLWLTWLTCSGRASMTATPFSNFPWILIHALETTGLDQPTNRCVKLQQQVGLFHNLLQIAEPL